MEVDKLKLNCSRCNGSEFYLQDGLYFCEECGLQYENLFEMEKDYKLEENFMGRKFAKDKSKKIKPVRLTSFEEYNHILINFVDEILEIEKIPEFKATTLQLWISYLQRSESAFFDKETPSAPKLFTVYRQADAEILYNKPPKEKKKQASKRKAADGINIDETNKERFRRMRRSEKIISSQLSESLKAESFNSSMLANLSIDTIISDHENMELEIEFSQVAKRARRKQGKKKSKHQGEEASDEADAPTQYKSLTRSERPQLLKGTTLLNIIYCALNICGSKIQLSDLLRFVKEGHLSYDRCKQLLPEELIENEVELSYKQYHSYHILNYETFRAQLTYFIKFIPDLCTSIRMPKLIELVERYLKEMQLPSDLKDYVERVIIMFPPEMPFKDGILLPNYEGRAMVLIIFTLKLLFGIDGYREDEMSRSAEKINRIIENHDVSIKLFSYKDWMAYIEYRQLILGKFYHPTLYHYTNSTEKPYVAFNSMLNSLHPKTRRNEGLGKSSKSLPRLQSKMNAQNILRQLMKNHDTGSDPSHMNSYTFPCSFTPLTDNFQHIVSQDDHFAIERSIAMADYTKHSCKAFLKPQTLIDTFKSINIELETTKSTFPKMFCFKHEVVWQRKEDFQLALDDMTEHQWRKDLKKRQALEKKVNAEEALNAHKKQMTRVLADRKYWQKKIEAKKKLRKYLQKIGHDTAVPEQDVDEPENFIEPNILSASESESDGEESNSDEIEFKSSIDPELEEIFQSHAKSQSDDVLKLVIPDYNYWHRKITAHEYSPKLNETDLETLPKNFLWLLRFAASIMHQHPLTLYAQLLIVEKQFLRVYQPVELFDNVILKQPNFVSKNALKW